MIQDTGYRIHDPGYRKGSFYLLFPANSMYSTGELYCVKGLRVVRRGGGHVGNHPHQTLQGRQAVLQKAGHPGLLNRDTNIDINILISRKGKTQIFKFLYHCNLMV